MINKILESFKRFIDYLKNSLENNRYKDLIRIGFSINLILALLMLLVLIIGFIKTYFIITNIDIIYYKYALHYILFIFGIIIIIKFIVQKILFNESSMFYKICKEKLNFYTLLSLFMVTLVITFGLTLFSQYYSSNLPINIKLSFVEEDIKPLYNLSVSSIEKSQCSSEGGYKDFVEGDILKCNIKLTYFDNSSYFLSKINIKKEMVRDSKKVDEINYFLQSQDHNFGINLEEEGVVIYRIYLYFQNDKTFEEALFLMSNLTLDTMSKSDYISKQSTHLPLLFTLLSIGISSVFIGIKNLKDILKGD